MHNNIEIDALKLGECIYKARKRKGFTQWQLMVAAGLTTSERCYASNLISRYENGHFVPQLERLLPICQVLFGDRMIEGLAQMLRYSIKECS